MGGKKKRERELFDASMVVSSLVQVIKHIALLQLVVGFDMGSDWCQWTICVFCCGFPDVGIVYKYLSS